MLREGGRTAETIISKQQQEAEIPRPVKPLTRGWVFHCNFFVTRILLCPIKLGLLTRVFWCWSFYELTVIDSNTNYFVFTECCCLSQASLILQVRGYYSPQVLMIIKVDEYYIATEQLPPVWACLASWA